MQAVRQDSEGVELQVRVVHQGPCVYEEFQLLFAEMKVVAVRCCQHLQASMMD